VVCETMPGHHRSAHYQPSPLTASSRPSAACRSACSSAGYLSPLGSDPRDLSAVCAFNEGRCNNFPLLLLARRAAAYALCFGLAPRWRYIETDRDVADAETRPWLLETSSSSFHLGDHQQHLRLFDHSPPAVQRGGARRACGRHL